MESVMAGVSLTTAAPITTSYGHSTTTMAPTMITVAKMEDALYNLGDCVIINKDLTSFHITNGDDGIVEARHISGDKIYYTISSKCGTRFLLWEDELGGLSKPKEPKEIERIDSISDAKWRLA